MDLDPNITEATESQWNLIHAILISSCSMSMIMFAKYPLDHFLGSGWALLCFIMFHLLFNCPVLYLQFRIFSHTRESIFVLLDRYMPVFNITVATANLIKVISGAYYLAISLAYLFFSIYNCDGRICIGGTFVWGSCADSWSEGDCKENFLLMRSDDILTGPEFPSWFNYRGLIAIPYIAAYTLIFLMTIGGSKVFGLLLYILSPLAVCLLTGVLITMGVNYADSTNQLTEYTNKFYRMFFAMIPINPDGVDTYEVQPLVWGFLSTFVHLSQTNNLWNGVYPVLGKLIGGGSKMRHLGWIPLAIGSILLGQLPVLIMLFAVASSYDPQYVRCHLSADWLAPFVIMSHIFSKFSSPRALVTSYFLGLALCLLLNQALILLTTVEHIVGHLTVINEKYEDHYKRIYRCSIVFTILLLGLLGLPLITQSGFYWIRLIDWFVDRLMIIPVIGQVAGFLTVYAQSKGTKFETSLLKTCVICIYAILFTFSGSIYVWYAFTGLQKPPDSQCRTFSRAPINDPLQDNFSLLGWLIAFGPIMLGIVIGLLLALIRFRSHHQYTRYSYFRYLFKGEYGLQKFTQITAHSSSQMKYNPPKFSNYPKNLSWTRINHLDDFGSTKLLSPNLIHQSHFAVNKPLYRSVGDGLGIFMTSNDNLSQASSTNRLPVYMEHSRRHRPDNYIPPQHRRSEVNIYNKSGGKTNEHQYYNSRYNRHHNYPNRHSVGRLDIYESEEFL